MTLPPFLESLLGSPLQVAQSLAQLALILIVYLLARWLLLRGLAAVMRKVSARVPVSREAYQGRLRTLHALLRSVVAYGLGIVVLVMALHTVGLNVAAILAGAGVVGLAVGFGAQRLVRDVITGIFILVEDQYAVGDYVTIGAHAGTVIEMGMRVTRLRDDQGKEVILANGDIITVVNHSRGPMLVSVDVPVAVATPLERVAGVVSEMGAALPAELFVEGPRVEGLAAMDALRMQVRISARARPGETRKAEMALRRAAREAFSRAEIPFA